jgi:hypothetical protein
LPLGASAIWLKPPIAVDQTHPAAQLTAEKGLRLIQGTDIAAAARVIKQNRV